MRNFLNISLMYRAFCVWGVIIILNFADFPSPWRLEGLLGGWKSNIWKRDILEIRYSQELATARLDLVLDYYPLGFPSLAERFHIEGLLGGWKSNIWKRDILHIIKAINIYGNVEPTLEPHAGHLALLRRQPSKYWILILTGLELRVLLPRKRGKQLQLLNWKHFLACNCHEHSFFADVGGVDKNDQMTSDYKINVTDRKWWLTVFLIDWKSNIQHICPVTGVTMLIN